MRRYGIVALVVSVVVLTLVGVGAQMIAGGEVGHITGVVTLVNGGPLAGVEVTLLGGGRILVTAAARGYRPTTVWATVTKGSTVKLSLPYGHRAEFIGLIAAAEGTSRLQTTSR